MSSYSQLRHSDSSSSPPIDEEQHYDDSASTLLPKSEKEELEHITPVRRFPFLRANLHWIPHILLLAAYSFVFFTWARSYQPYPPASDDIPPLSNIPPENWEVRFDGTFAEIGDYFNVSAVDQASPGAAAAWSVVEKNQITNSVERRRANFVKIDRALIRSPKAGDMRALTRIHRLHCLHVLWRRWHNDMSAAEVAAGITTEPHDQHCFDVLRYTLICESDMTIERVGWPGTDDMREAWIDVAGFCEGMDPDANGVEGG